MRLDTLALFGGTFNPPHRGHLEPISAAAQEFGLKSVNLLLSPQPPHKRVSGASLQQRKEMLQLACENFPVCQPDFTEIQLPSPSYTVNTLRHFRALHPRKSLVFFIGGDSLANIHTWHSWQSLLEYAHIIVLPRPDYALPQHSQTADWIENHQQTDRALLRQSTHGSLFFAETPLWDVSSTQLRQHFADITHRDDRQKQSLAHFLPKNVIEYIIKQKLYQLSDSS